MLAAVLLYGPPATLEVTSTVMVHAAWAALIDAPVTVMVPEPAAVATTPVPDGQLVEMAEARRRRRSPSDP
jgi:hypothetical protein